MVRRMIRQAGSLAVAGWMWNHRGTVARGADLLLRTPQLVRTGRTADLPLEIRSLVALDETHPTNTAVRITSIADGAVMLRDLNVADLEAARSSLCSLREVGEVRTQPADQPTFDDALAQASS